MISSVTFTFKAKTTGSGTFSISKITLPVSYTTGSVSTSVTVEAAKSTNTNTNTNQSTNKTTTKKTTTKKTTTNNNENQEPEEIQEPEVVEKKELYTLIQELGNLVQTDYTEQSWNELQELITKAETVATNAEYDEIKEKLTTEGLVPETFEKKELDKVLRLLIGKLEKDYLPESWNSLIEAIDKADSATLKSEYDKIKAELTVNNLVLKEDKGFFGELIEKAHEDTYVLGLVICVMVLAFILMIVTIICLHRSKKSQREFGENVNFAERYK